MSEEDEKRKFDGDPSPWIPETDRVKIAVLGKAIEEFSELMHVLAQYNSGIVPDAQDFTNLWHEIADVRCQISHVRKAFDLGLLYPSHHNIPVGTGYTMQVLAIATNVLGRTLIQGIDEVEPSTGVSNRRRLWQALSEVHHHLTVLTRDGFDLEAILEREDYKFNYLQRWLDQLQFMPEQ